MRDLDEIIDDWAPPPRPQNLLLRGNHVQLEPLDAERHAIGLHQAYAEAETDEDWRWLPYGPFATAADYAEWIRNFAVSSDPYFLAIRDCHDDTLLGVASYLRVNPEAGSIEVGHIHFSPLLQRRPAATETMYLMMRWAFQAGYRRYEWKCNALNRRSRQAAQRLGFSYEGIFRQATLSRGRNRDTAWFAMIDKEWPMLEQAFTTWLDDANFDADGRQRVALSSLTAPVRVMDDPGLTPLQG